MIENKWVAWAVDKAKAFGAGVRNLGSNILNSRPVLYTAAVIGFTWVAGSTALAQTNGTDIATGAQTAFNVVAPIVVTIATFFVVVRIAKRVTR